MSKVYAKANAVSEVKGKDEVKVKNKNKGRTKADSETGRPGADVLP